MRHGLLQRGRLLAVCACLLLAIVHTWPLAANPVTLSRNDNGDAQLNEWILAWVAHQLPLAPGRLFQANIFYPANDTLAFSEPLIAPAILGMPLRWLGGSPVLVFNIVLILGFALTAFAGYLLVHDWTGDHAAGMLAGSLFAFNTHTLTRLAHIQGIHAWGLPLALLAADRLIQQTRLRDALWLALWMTAMAYTSGYLVVFASVMVAVVLLVRLPEWWRRATHVVPLVGLAAIVSAAAALPLYLSYRRVAVEYGMVRSLDNVAGFSATLAGYVASAGRLYYALWSKPLFEGPIDAFFPGFVALILAAGAIVWITRRKHLDSGSPSGLVMRHRVLTALAIAVAGFVLSFGPQTPIYSWLFHVFPPLQGLRAAARFGNLFLLGTAVLAGIGLATLRQRLPAGRRALVAAAIIVLANLESLRAPFQYTRFEGIPAIYSLVAEEPGPVVLVEMPFYPPALIFENSTYMVYSTAHFRPLMNGYSGYIPGSYRRYVETFSRFPEEQAILAMREAGATHVMVHPTRFNLDPERTAALMTRTNASPLLERIAIGQNGVTLFKVK
jgi:hypothetical protein